MQSRYYDPEIGRFLNADAFASTGQGILGNNMFAYCGNNPVSCSDPSGYCACTLTGGKNNEFEYTTMCSCGGSGAGGGGIVFALGYAIANIIEQTSANTQAVSKEDEKADVYVDAKSGQRKHYQYWEANRVGNNVVVGDGLTFVEASARVALGFNIMCASQDAAKWILVVNCYWNAVGPEIGRGDGFFWHYHPHRETDIHIWFYGGIYP